MNKIYKVIWSKTRNCYVAVSELAKNHGKNSVRSEKRGLVKGTSALALCIALSLGVTGSVWAADPLENPVAGDLTVKGNVIIQAQADGEDPTDVIKLGADGSITAGSLSIGTGNTVSGTNSVAIGVKNTASGNYSFAGGGNTVRVITGGTYYNPYHIAEETSETGSEALGINSFAYGYQAKAVGDHSFAFGHQVEAGAEDSTEGTSSWNQRPLINGYAAAFGYKTKATGSGSFAAGLETKALGKGSVSTGISTTASGAGAVAMGNGTRASYDNSFASGSNTTAGPGFIGYSNLHTWLYPNKTYGYYGETNPGDFDYYSGINAAAFGENTTAAGKGSVAFGLGESFSDNYYGSYSAGPADPDHYYRPNSGKTGAYGDYSATFGSGTFTLGPNSVAMGSKTNAIGQNAVAWGYLTYAVGKDSTAFGNNTLATGNRSTAFGSQTEAAAQDSLAFGIDTKAYASRSTAFGSHSLATGEKSTAFGTSSAAQSENSTAFGERSQASGKNALAFGHYSTTGVRYQSEQDKKDGIYTMTVGGSSSYSDSPYIPSNSSYNQVKVKVEDKQFAWVLTDQRGDTVKATKDGKEYIVYHAHTNAYQSSWGTPPADPTYAIKYREYDENGNPGDYYYQEVSYDPDTGEITLMDNIVRVADNNPDQLSLTDLGNEDDDALYEKNKTPRFQYVMDESSSAKNAVAFGNDTNAQADNSLAFGDANIAGGKRSTAFGNHTQAMGDSATSFGDNTLASARNATAFGESSRATQQNATAFGQENAALAKNASAWGHKTKATGEASTAYGNTSLAAGKYATSFGERSVSFAQDSVSWGEKSVAGISTKDTDYNKYIDMISGTHQDGSEKSLVELENALKAARKAGDIAETARLTSEIAEYEGQIATYYKTHFSVADQAAADKLNQETVDALNQQTVSTLNQQKANEINMENLTDYCTNTAIPSNIAYQNWLTAQQLGKNVNELTDDERWTIDKLVALYNEDMARSLGKSVEELTDDEKLTTENLASKMAESMPVEYQKDVLGDNFMTEENLPDDQKMTADNLPEDQKMTVDKLPDEQKAVAKNLGRNATAWGKETNAYGRAATAWGNKTIAAGANSTAFGNQSIAVGGDSTAFGKSSKAWGDNSLAALGGTTGKGSETENGYTVETNATGAIAIGKGAAAEKSNNVAIGQKAKASGTDTIAIGAVDADGKGSTAKGANSIAIGTANTVNGNNSIAIGTGHTVSGKNSGAFGDPDIVEGDNSYVIGNNSTISVSDAFILGNSASVTANGGVALGTGSVASRAETETGSIAQQGYDMSTKNAHTVSTSDVNGVWSPTASAVSVGAINSSDSSKNITRRITGVAAGSDDTDAVNVAQLKAFVGGSSSSGGDGIHYYSTPEDSRLPEDQRHEANYNNEGATGKYSMAAGVNATATGGSVGSATAVGGNAKATASSSTALGANTSTSGSDTLAAGAYAKANGYQNTALGANSLATGSRNASGTESSGSYNTAVGASSVVYGTQSTAVGNNSLIQGSASNATSISSANNSAAFGYNTKVYGGNNTALGSNAWVSGPYGSSGYDTAYSSVAVGSYTRVYGGYNTALGASTYIQASTNNGLPYNTSVSNSVAAGYYNRVYGSYDTSIGSNAQVTGTYSSGFGYQSQVYGERNNTAIGANSRIGDQYFYSYDQSTGIRSHRGANNTAIGAQAMVGSGYNNVAIGTNSRAGYWSDYTSAEREAAVNAAMENQYGDQDGINAEIQNRAGKIIDAQIASNPPPDYDNWSDEQKTEYRNYMVYRYLSENNNYNRTQMYNDMAFEQWQSGNVQSDDYSTAIGVEAQAAGAGQTAIGGRAKALGWHSTAIGLASSAKGASAIAIGESANTNDNQEIAVGNYAHTYGQSSIAMGRLAGGNTNYAIAIGDNATVQYRPEEQWVVAGYNTDGTAIVNEEDQTNHVQRLVADHSIAIGRDSYVDAKDATAVGRNTQARMRNATAYGNNAHANAWNSIAIGNKATAGLQADILNDDDDTVKGPDVANSAIAIGNRARATAEYTTAVGAGTNAEGWHAVAVGDSNQATGRFSTAIGAGWSINHTEGEDDKDNTTDDATGDGVNTEGLRTYESIGSNVAAGDYSTSVGYGNTTVSEHSLAVGAGNVIGDTDGDKDASGIVIGGDEKATGSIAFGNWNTVTGKQSIAVGTGLTVTGNNSGAFGDPGKLDGDSSYMIGNDNEITDASDYSFIVGNNVKTTAPNTVVFGQHSAKNAHTFGENSVSLGFDAVAQEDDSVALGSKSVASRDITKEGAGYDVLTGRPYDGKDREGKAYKNAVNPKSPIWTPTRGEVAVGDVENNITRRITGVAAGAEDTDAVNVAQLKIATTGFQTHYYSVEIDDPDDPDGLGSNYDNLGATKPGSVAAGYYTSATGFNSTAVGNMTRAEDSNSVAVGHQAHAHSEDSTAIGVDADAYGKGAIAFGHQATSGVLVRITPNMKESDEGYDPTKVKYEATIIQQTKDNDSYVFRARKEKDENNQPKVAAYNVRTQDYYEAKLNDNGNYDIGNKIEVKESDLDMGGIAMGSFAHSEGDRSLAVGRASGAYGEDSAAIGINSNALGDGGLAIGHGSSVGVQAEVKPSSKDEGADRANGFWTTEVERDATGNPKANGAIGGIAIGSYAHTEGTRALAVGRVASAYGENSTAMGLRSSAYGEGSMAFGHGVVAGNENDKYAAQVPDLHNNPSMNYDLDGKDGTHVQTSNVIGAVALGSYAEATGRGSLSVGRYSEAQSAYTVAMGIRAEAGEKSENAIAIGREAKVAAGSGDYGGSNSIAMGTLANVKGMNSIAIGTAEFTNKEGTDVLDREERKGTSVTGNSSIAIGQSDTITGDNSIAIGTGHVIKGNNSGAFGDPNSVNADASYIVGNNSKIDGKDTVTGIDSSPVKDAFILGNDSNVSKSFGVALGSKTTVSAEGGVALGSESVASRGTSTGGFNVVTGAKDYTDGTSTWESTHAAVSVGTTDGKVTRQITGLAAGTEDTDAVNVAQLKLAVGGVTYTAGKNITIDGNVINATGSVYTANQTVEAGGPGEGRTTLNITDGDGGDAGSMTVKAGKNVTITEEKESGKSIAVINATDTTYTVTSEAGDAGTNVVNNYTMTGTNGDKYTFSDTDTTYTADQVVNAGTGWKNDEGGSTTFTITDSSGNNLKPMTIKAGDNVKITKGENGEAVIQGNGLKNDENAVVYDENGEGSVTITDQAGNTTKITNIRSLGGEGIADSINYLGDRINNLDKKINKVGAGAAALAGLHPLDFDPDEKWDFSAAAGSYKGEHAVAIGAFYRPNEDTMFSVGGTIGNGNNMVNVGVSWKFGQKNRISANRISSAKEIIELRKNQEDVHSFLADAVAGNQLDLSKIQLFPDVEENHWAYDYVATMAGNGILEGYPDGYFKGNRNMTRYEMAAVLYRLMQNGARLSDRALTEFAPELDRIRVDTITKHKDGTPHIQRVRTIKERVDEKADPSSEKAAKKKAKVKVAEKPVV